MEELEEWLRAGGNVDVVVRGSQFNPSSSSFGDHHYSQPSLHAF
jgi:hypothetical protein